MKQTYIKQIIDKDGCFILAKGEALVIGISLKLCFRVRRAI